MALFCVCSLALLCGCGEGAPEGTDSPATEMSTTAEPITLDPNRPKAIMEPVQGGPMLYAFPGDEEYIYGLINQDGEVIAEPRYGSFFQDSPQYVYSDATRTRVIGLVASQQIDERDSTFTYYSLDGTAKMLNCEGRRIRVAPGGRYAFVAMGTWPEEHEELFDIEANTYEVEPKDGLLHFETGQMIAPPAKPGIFNDYLPEVEWFCFVDNRVFRWYDAAFNHMPQLDNWRIHPFNGKYAHMHMDGSPVTAAWVDREGNIVKHIEGSINYYYSDPLFCYIVNRSNRFDDSLLFDADLKTVFEGNIIAFDGPLKGYVLLDEQRQVQASCDVQGKPLPVNETPYVLSAGPGHWQWLRLQDGVWRTPPDLSAYGLRHSYYYDAGFSTKFVGASVVEAYEEFILISGWQGLAKKKQKKYIEPSLIAIDWDGNLYPDCPLELFYGSAIFVEDDYLGAYQWRTAGPQGPSYYWVELDNKRGYINTRGEWLFIDES